VRVAMPEHGKAAQDEIKHLADEFTALKQKTTVPTPAIDRLSIYFDPDAQPMPEGSAHLPLDWRFLRVIAGVLTGILVIVWLLLALLQ
jgi:hypothetical protein